MVDDGVVVSEDRTKPLVHNLVLNTKESGKAKVDGYPKPFERYDATPSFDSNKYSEYALDPQCYTECEYKLVSSGESVTLLGVAPLYCARREGTLGAITGMVSTIVLVAVSITYTASLDQAVTQTFEPSGLMAAKYCSDPPELMVAMTVRVAVSITDTVPL